MSLFGELSPPPPHLTPVGHRDRVRSKIEPAIMSFMRNRGMFNPFVINQLHAWVVKRCPVAPASADRILRLLRQDGVLNYRVLNRAKALYEFMP